MILVTTALYCEAKPLIEHFSLNRDKSISHSDIYKGNEMYLIISGTGVIKSASASMFLLGCNHSYLNTCASLNIGVCGSISLNTPIGLPVLINKAVNASTGRSYYPDILIENTLAEGAVCSFSSPVSALDIKENFSREGVGYVDMEAAGFMEAALTLLPPHRVQCLKIVSDHLDVGKLDPAFTERLVEKALPQIRTLMNDIEKLCGRHPTILSQEDLDIVDEITSRLRLSASMRYQLIHLAEQYAVRTGAGLETALSNHFPSPAGSKKEGKIPFMEIRRILTGDDI